MAAENSNKVGDNTRKRKLPNWMIGASNYDDTTETKASESNNCNHGGLNLPYLQFKGSTIYSYQEDDCSILCDDILESISEDEKLICGFDIEWPVTYKVGESPKTALLQLCTSQDTCYLFHLSRMISFPNGLMMLLKDERIMKTGVGIESDFWKLARDFDVPAMEIIRHSMVDLSPWASRVLKSKQNWSLDNLCQNMLLKQLNKDPAVRKSDWSRFPLSDIQKSYAATDAYAGLLLYEECQRRQKIVDEKS